MRRTIMAFIFGALMLGAAPARAQDNIDGFAAELMSLNLTPASRDLAYETYQEVLNLKVLDTNRQWIGGVEDLKIDEGGIIAEVVSEINRIGREEYLVRHQAGEVAFSNNVSAFVVPLPSASVITSPEALAAIAPAAGNGGEVYSFRAMMEAEVFNTGGNYLGTVTNLLVDEDMKAVRALVLENVPGARRYTGIAVPFNPEFVSINTRFGEIEFRLTPEAAQAVTDFARERR